MDDLVFNVRQIAQYNFAASIGPQDAILVQQGGVGGNYVWTNAAGLLAPWINQKLSIGALDVMGPISWPGSGVELWGSAGALTAFNGNAPLFGATTTMFTVPGSIDTGGSVTLGRFPVNPMEAVPAQYMADNTVWSFNGRRGTICLEWADVLAAGGAPIQSPTFVGTPRAPTVSPLTRDTQIATTEFVHEAWCKNFQAIICTQPFVFTFNGRTGVIELTLKDIEGAGGAPIQSPDFTGIPTVPDPRASDYSHQIANTRWVTWQTNALAQSLQDLSDVVYQKIDASAFATLDFVEQTYAPINSPSLTGYATAPTPAPGTNNAQLATTAFVMAAVEASTAGVASFNGRTGIVTLDSSDITEASGALLDSPAFVGTPTGPTAVTGTASTQLATTAFVMNEISAIDAGVVTFNNRSGAVNLLWTDVQAVGGAPIASPNFTGVPTAATASPGTNTTQLATTAFVTAAIAGINTGVLSFEGRTGAVQLTSNDISARGGALIASPAFTGVPTAPTASLGTSSTQLATTAFVAAALAGASNVTSFNSRAGNITLTKADILNIAGLALVVTMQSFETQGTYTYTPPAGLQAAIVTVVGAGGGGGAAYSSAAWTMGGGSGGSCAEAHRSLFPGRQSQRLRPCLRPDCAGFEDRRISASRH